MMNIVFIEKEKKLINRVEIKTEAKSLLREHWKNPILVSLVVILVSSLFNFKSIMSVITGVPLNIRDIEASPENDLFIFIWQLFAFIISVASAFFYLHFVQERETASFQTFLDGFNLFWKATLTFLLLVVRLIGWFLLLIIPAFIKALAYSQVRFIIADYPDIKITEAFHLSNLMTRGYKLDIFVFYLSFIGWILLSFFTHGIANIFVLPYINTATTNLYLKLKENAVQASLIDTNTDEKESNEEQKGEDETKSGTSDETKHNI